MDAIAAGSLSVTGITKRFGQTEVLRGVSVDLPRGEFATLLGPSGCGKTTLLRIIAGLELADAGTVKLSGVDVTRVPANKRPVNTVFQHYALFPHLTVRDNVAVGLRSRRFAEADVKKRVGEALGMLQLDALADRRPDQLSGGQRQRVAVARAVVNEPELLLLDEPLSALDAKLRGEVQVELRRLQRRLGTTFLLVTHDQDEALSVSDRILVMDRGLVAQQGTPQEVYKYPRTRFVASFMGGANLIPVSGRDGDGLVTALGTLRVEKPPAWSTGTVSIHPERIHVVATPPAVNGAQATVREAIYRGDHVELHVEHGGLTILVQGDTDVAARPGQVVSLELPMDDLRVLDD
jgi:spermidine/putrescine transport system ATP-binding protein